SASDIAGLITAHIRLINFDVALEHFKAIGLDHQLADLLTHAPCRFVGHAKRPFQFLAAYAVARRDKQIDRIEPNLERRTGILKDGASGRVNVVATVSAGEGAALLKLVER